MTVLISLMSYHFCLKPRLVQGKVPYILHTLSRQQAPGYGDYIQDAKDGAVFLLQDDTCSRPLPVFDTVVSKLPYPLFVSAALTAVVMALIFPDNSYGHKSAPRCRFLRPIW